MKLTRRQLLLGASLSASTSFLVACSGALSTPTTAPTQVPSPNTTTSSTAPNSSASPVVAGSQKVVRAGYVPVMVFAPIFIAIEKGYFREQGIETAATSFTNGADILAQTASGNLDVGLSGLGASALNAFQRGLDLRIVSAQHSERPPLATPLIVAKKKFDDGTYKQVPALKGKKVSVNAKGTGTEYWLYSALKKNGLTMQEIELTSLAFDQVAAALNNGSLDGAMVSEPLVTLAENQGLVTRIADDFLTDAQGTMIFYNMKWSRENATTADRWLAAWLRGARDLNNGGYAKDENAAIIEKYTKTPAAIVKVAKPPHHEPNGILNLTDMRDQQAYFLSSGSLTYTAPIDVTSLTDTGFAERAVAIIGKG